MDESQTEASWQALADVQWYFAGYGSDDQRAEGNILAYLGKERILRGCATGLHKVHFLLWHIRGSAITFVPISHATQPLHPLPKAHFHDTSICFYLVQSRRLQNLRSAGVTPVSSAGRCAIRDYSSTNGCAEHQIARVKS